MPIVDVVIAVVDAVIAIVDVVIAMPIVNVPPNYFGSGIAQRAGVYRYYPMLQTCVKHNKELIDASSVKRYIGTK